jgi:hypothetical protein
MYLLRWSVTSNRAEIQFLETFSASIHSLMTEAEKVWLILWTDMAVYCVYFYLLQRLTHLISFQLSPLTHILVTSLFSLFNLYHMGKEKLNPGVRGPTFGTPQKKLRGLLRQWTIPTERPPLVSEVSADFSRYRVSHSQRNKSPQPLISVIPAAFETRINHIETMERSHMDLTLSGSPSAVTLFTCPNILLQAIQFTGMLVVTTFASNKCFGMAEIQWRGTQQYAGWG